MKGLKLFRALQRLIGLTLSLLFLIRILLVLFPLIRSRQSLGNISSSYSLSLSLSIFQARQPCLFLASFNLQVVQTTGDDVMTASFSKLAKLPIKQ